MLVAPCFLLLLWLIGIFNGFTFAVIMVLSLVIILLDFVLGHFPSAPSVKLWFPLAQTANIIVALVVGKVRPFLLKNEGKKA